MTISQRRATGIRRPCVVVLVAAVSVAALLAAVPGAARAGSAPAGSAAAPRTSDADLRRGPDLGGPVRGLDGRLRRSGVDAVIGSAGQRRLGGGCGRAAGVPAGSLVHCWDREDSVTRTWVPQGVTGISDAVDDERWSGGGRPLLVSWHDKGSTRVTFVNPDRRSYRHVLLVEPGTRGGRPTFGDIDVHAGGIAWFGNRLYVADTRRGVREFDMRQIYDLAASRAGSTEHEDRIGLHGGKYYGHGFRYVLAQTGSWLYARGGAGPRCRGAGPLRTSWLSIDRTTYRPVLIAGEYCRPSAPRGRVVTWPLSGLTGGASHVRADWIALLPDDKIQGGVRTHGQWWFTHNRGTRRGQLLTAYRDWDEWGGVRRMTISHGPEDLSCYRGQGRLWTVAEHAHRRALYGLPARSCY
ncbi:hypothetical protein AGRA3207_005835 [Actinomadura graeca]|uniref:Secreted protein n=1 Tax=Actinomadura graeca TaxID=2750812 RepID=A0ABX8R0G7_9ACTN|nr:hypothetical protein [Actinomadura graeca]QXJ24500.1 hypothetical protein AGRA3207_005835 [Actinomadura graeca]